MGRYWFTIAKAEYFAQMSRFHRRRTVIITALVALGIIWAIFILPWIISMIMNKLGARAEAFLMISLPGTMRSVILMLWMLLLVFPISGALQEIKIGQWEIILSQNVRTRDLLTGTFLGKIPTHGLLVLFLAPVLITPFTAVFHVSVFGQLLLYGILILLINSTLWCSTVLGTAIQAKLGESERGNDMAKGFSVLIVLAFLLPFYGLMYYSGPLTTLMGMDVFLLLPSSWGADLITWIIIKFSGLNLTVDVLDAFKTMLGFTALLDFMLIVIFSVVIVGISLVTADRLFKFGTGGSRATVTTIRSENLFLRGLHRIIPGSFGVLVVTAIKDFTRKVQNLSKFLYGMIIAIIVPILQRSALDLPFFVMIFQVGMIMGIISGTTFGGIGFLDSQDQLWIIKSAPNGVSKFVKARLVEAFIFSIPLAMIPIVLISVIIDLSVVEGLILLGMTYSMMCGAAMLGTGFTANNPYYEDTKSGSFGANMGLTVLTFFGITILSLIITMKLESWFDLDPLILIVLTLSAFPILIGAVICIIGTYRLAKSDKD